MSWLNDVLWDGDRMLYFDGANLRPQDVMVDDITGRRDVPLDVERNIYTYNQGTTLAVLLALAESSGDSYDRREEYLLRAERLIVGIVKTSAKISSSRTVHTTSYSIPVTTAMVRSSPVFWCAT